MSARPMPEPATGIAPNGRPFESVWDYPRPPRIEPVDRRVRVRLGDAEVVDTIGAARVVETAGAPVVYVPPAAVAEEALRPVRGTTFCEWKGTATYFDVVGGDLVAERAAFAYAGPTSAFEPIRGWISFYPALVGCLLDDEPVGPQPGGFYAGWVTAEIAGPIKGAPGSAGW